MTADPFASPVLAVPAAASGQTVLLTGATGFVGQRLWPRLVEAGYSVRCLTRRPDAARVRWPERNWVPGDLADPAALARALNGCGVAFFLIHGMGEQRSDYHEREVAGALRFAQAAESAGVNRIVYLGGVAPQGVPSRHLQSRLEVGAALMSTTVPVLELRAAMIVGAGSLSWIMVRDLAARLPFMVLPRWLRSKSQPIAIDDVVSALVAGLTIDLAASQSYDLPGPEILTGKETLIRAAVALGFQPPICLEVPVLSLRLSSYWLRLVTRADWDVAREIVLGLQNDLLARDASYWQRIDKSSLLSFVEAATQARREEPTIPLGGFGGWLERRRRPSV